MAFSVHGINLTSLWTSISIGFYSSCAHAPLFNAFPLVFTLHDRHSIVFYDENEHFLNAETTLVLALRSSNSLKFFQKFFWRLYTDMFSPHPLIHLLYQLAAQFPMSIHLIKAMNFLWQPVFFQGFPSPVNALGSCQLRFVAWGVGQFACELPLLMAYRLNFETFLFCQAFPSVISVGIDNA